MTARRSRTSTHPALSPLVTVFAGSCLTVTDPRRLTTPADHRRSPNHRFGQSSPCRGVGMTAAVIAGGGERLARTELGVRRITATSSADPSSMPAFGEKAQCDRRHAARLPDWRLPGLPWHPAARLASTRRGWAWTVPIFGGPA